MSELVHRCERRLSLNRGGLALHCAGKIRFQARNISPSPSGFWVKKSGTTMALYCVEADELKPII